MAQTLPYAAFGEDVDERQHAGVAQQRAALLFEQLLDDARVDVSEPTPKPAAVVIH